MIYVDMSMSLDGFVAGPRVGVDNPMGRVRARARRNRGRGVAHFRQRLKAV